MKQEEMLAIITVSVSAKIYQPNKSGNKLNAP
jgi:hypothetical protein